MWNIDDSRLQRLERAVKYLACKIENGGGGNQNLQQVTDNGNFTTNQIETSSNVSALNYSFSNLDQGYYSILYSQATEGRSWAFPDKSGTVALLDDIPVPATMQSAYDNGNTITNLINAQGDATFTRQLVVKNDGTIGADYREPLTQILGSINAENVPAGLSVFGTVFKKADVWTIHLRDLYIPLGTPRSNYIYIGDISSTYDIRVPFEVMFPTLIRVVDASFNSLYYSGTLLLQQRQMAVILPPQAITGNPHVYVTSYFQFTNTNTSP